MTKTIRRTLEDDVDRLAERIWDSGHHLIQDGEDFNNVFDNYLIEVNEKQDTTLRKKVFDALRRKHPGVSTKGEHLSEKKKKEFTTRVLKRKEFTYIGKSGKRVVMARRTILQVKGKERVVYRDMKGRFVKITPTTQKKEVRLKRIK